MAITLYLLEPEECWLLRNRDAVNADLDESFAQAARGEGYCLNEAKTILAEHHAARIA